MSEEIGFEELLNMEYGQLCALCRSDYSQIEGDNAGESVKKRHAVRTKLKIFYEGAITDKAIEAGMAVERYMIEKAKTG